MAVRNCVRSIVVSRVQAVEMLIVLQQVYWHVTSEGPETYTSMQMRNRTQVNATKSGKLNGSTGNEN